ncbi:hypothetical protein HYT26_00790 [Candidatus Pacearchaeota archaeon]|nr:hypothetical protein [Candidatus Pacearchaeota archaeon]
MHIKLHRIEDVGVDGVGLGFERKIMWRFEKLNKEIFSRIYPFRAEFFRIGTFVN